MPIKLTLSLMVLVSIKTAGAEPLTELLSREPCATSPDNYAQYVERQLGTFRQEAAAAAKLGLRTRSELEARAAQLSPQDYARRHRPGVVICERLTYRSDGLRVVGYVWHPSQRTARRLPQRLPVIVFSRGGVADDSKLRPNTQFGFFRFIEAGYAVVGTQYRGNEGGEGRDELGGADVNDVLNLLELARGFDFVDADKVFALGYSRGAMETLLAARSGAPFKAVALVGLPADMLKSRSTRSDEMYRKFIPDYDAKPEQALRARSAILWPEKISMPMLLLQGSADPLVLAHNNSIPFAARLGELHQSYELVVYDGDTHGVMLNARDRDQRIISWFRRYERPIAP